MAATQPVLWANKPDVAAFEKIENAHLAAAQKFVDQVVAVKGQRTTANTLVPFDEAVREITSTWGSEQVVMGPVLIIPFKYNQKTWKEQIVNNQVKHEVIAGR